MLLSGTYLGRHPKNKMNEVIIRRKPALLLGKKCKSFYYHANMLELHADIFIWDVSETPKSPMSQIQFCSLESGTL